jgi:hypothetical protein
VVIAAPASPSEYPDRDLDCELAIEPYFNELMKFAELTGRNSSIIAISMLRHCSIGHLPPQADLDAAIHEAFSTLELVALASGWQRGEVLSALAGLCRRYLRRKPETPIEPATGNAARQPKL